MTAQELMDDICSLLVVYAGASLDATTTDGPTSWADADLTIGGVQFYLSIESGER